MQRAGCLLAQHVAHLLELVLATGWVCRSGMQDGMTKCLRLQAAALFCTTGTIGATMGLLTLACIPTIAPRFVLAIHGLAFRATAPTPASGNALNTWPSCRDKLRWPCMGLATFGMSAWVGCFRHPAACNGRCWGGIEAHRMQIQSLKRLSSRTCHAVLSGKRVAFWNRYCFAVWVVDHAPA